MVNYIIYLLAGLAGEMSPVGVLGLDVELPLATVTLRAEPVGAVSRLGVGVIRLWIGILDGVPSSVILFRVINKYILIALFVEQFETV